MRERSKGRWQLRVFEGTDPLTGQKHYRTKNVEGTKRDAQRALAALVTEVDKGTVAPAAKTVSALLAAWLEHIEHLGRSPTTLYGYRRLIARLACHQLCGVFGRIGRPHPRTLYVTRGVLVGCLAHAKWPRRSHVEWQHTKLARSFRR